MPTNCTSVCKAGEPWNKTFPHMIVRQADHREMLRPLVRHAQDTKMNANHIKQALL